MIIVEQIIENIVERKPVGLIFSKNGVATTSNRSVKSV